MIINTIEQLNPYLKKSIFFYFKRQVMPSGKNCFRLMDYEHNPLCNISEKLFYFLKDSGIIYLDTTIYKFDEVNFSKIFNN